MTTEIAEEGLFEVLLWFDGLAKRMPAAAARVAPELASGMEKIVPVKTGFLKSSIYSQNDEAGALAPYAGFVAARTHYPEVATEGLLEDLADWLVGL